jgi:hypothetical protein
MIGIQSNRVKTIGIWCLAIFLFLSHVLLRAAHAEEVTIQAPSDNWKEIQSRTGDCRISFPSIPKMVQQTLNVSEKGHKLLYDIYLAPLKGKSLCLLLVATYPFPLKEGHEVAGLEGLLRGIVGNNAGNQLVFANVLEHKGHPVVDFLVQSSTSFFRGQALMVENKLYLIGIEGKDGELDEVAFRRFAESFSLVSH